VRFLINLRRSPQSLRLIGLCMGGVLLLLLVAVLLLPQLLSARAEAAIAQRTGLSADIDDVGIDGGGVTLRGVHLSAADASAARVDVQRIDAQFSWLSALLHGTSAVKSVRVSGVTADVDMQAPELEELRRRLSQAPAEAKKQGDPGEHARELGLADFKLRVREGATELLALDGTSAQLKGKHITTSLRALRVEKPGLVSGTLHGVDVTLLREQGVLRLSHLHVDTAQLAIETPVMPAQLEETKAEHSPDTDDEDADNDSVVTEGDNKQAAEVAQTAAAQTVEPTVEGTPAPAPAPEHLRSKSLQSLFARLTPDAVIELWRAQIEQVTGGLKQPILNDLACELRVLDGSALHITGKGAASTGGRLHVDMTVWPNDLRADGRVSMSALPLTLFVPVLPRVPWYEPEKGRIQAELTIKAESPERVALNGYAHLSDIGVASARLATVPVEGIDFSIAGTGHWLPVDRRLELASGSIGLGKAKAEVKGAVELTDDHYAFDIAANLKQAPCTEVVRSIPRALLGDMALAKWRGTLGGKLRLQTDSRDLEKTILSFDINDKCGFEVVPVLADLSRFARPFVHSVTEPDGSVFSMQTGPGSENWTPIEQISPFLVHAIMVHEDPQFFSHHGFSPIHIRNALVRDLQVHRFAVGASTISMQLVKNVFLHREKTLARKLQEVLLTWWTERVMQKRDILELYLNVIEYGPGVYGIRKAAQHYWNRSPSELSPAESVFLAQILPAPKRYHTHYQRNALTPGWAAGMRAFLKRLGERGSYDQAAVEYGLQEIERFKFARPGQLAEPRELVGSAAPLPYQQTAIDAAAETSQVADDGGAIAPGQPLPSRRTDLGFDDIHTTNTTNMPNLE